MANAQAGFIYIKITDVLPAFRSVPGVERLLGMVKLGKTNDLARRDAQYKTYLPMLFHTVFAVRVDNRHVAEQLVLEHFRKHNVRSEVSASARRTTPELAKVAEQVGVECFRMDREAAKAVLLMFGDEVAEPPALRLAA
jgi:T5orf172 domain